jgi:hypothetical protein
MASAEEYKKEYGINPDELKENQKGSLPVFDRMLMKSGRQWHGFRNVGGRQWNY